ncbi:MAG TPA: sigma-70 family RNA polymerase sigma factor [Anaeromyxobacteraceae bacterium]|jgi:RNA polymerase sigma-70 factor (ECF subfamily)|nr:sigma-70 family RNA polymerase sigma factor [Anaeromyxobacteraceae bacterium]
MAKLEEVPAPAARSRYESVMEGALHPDPDALAREALAHADALYGYARHLCGNAAEAEDLVQETYARALRGREGIHADASLRAWLFTILRNAFLSARRHDGRGAAAQALHAGEPDPAEDEWLRGDLELERLRRLVSEEIEAALGELSEEARTVILLHLEGFSEAEIAEVAGCAAGTVKSRLSRARAALRVRLAHYAREGRR